jgi:hypothetical protein
LLGGIHYLVLGGEATWETAIDTHAAWLSRWCVEQPVQTNEVFRGAPLARGVAATGRSRVELLELGASAGLLLYLEGPFEVVRRRGIDRRPVDVNTAEGVRLLEAFVWPGQPERVERLRAAIEVARRDPPELIEGDYVDVVTDYLTSDTVVVSAVTTMYLEDERYDELRGKLRNVDWVSLEGPRHARDYDGMQLILNGRVLEEHVDFHG